MRTTAGVAPIDRSQSPTLSRSSASHSAHDQVSGSIEETMSVKAFSTIS